MTTITKYKRRTFKDVAAEAHARGWTEGLQQGRSEALDKYHELLDKNNDLDVTATILDTTLTRIKGSLITALKYHFTGRV